MATLRPQEVARQVSACPVVFVPSGPCEWRDEHNPLGTDTLKAAEICRQTARRTGGVAEGERLYERTRVKGEASVIRRLELWDERRKPCTGPAR